MGADQLNGGAGTDQVSYATRSSDVTADPTGSGDDGAAGEGDTMGADVEGAAGGSGNDQLTGSDGDGAVQGGDGNDVLGGGDGDDTVNGGPGNDTLSEGSTANGADVLVGDTGL